MVLPKYKKRNNKQPVKRRFSKSKNRKIAPQCRSLNKDGTKCKRTTYNLSGLYHDHEKGLNGWQYRQKKKVKVIEIIDGDTFKIEQKLLIRPEGYDTPEENEKGYFKAKKDLTSIIPPGSFIYVLPLKKDKFGRFISNVKKSGKNLSDLMKKKGW